MEYRTDSERIAVIEEVVTDLRVRLFGNGQPGAIAKLEDRITKVEAQFRESKGRRAAWVAIGGAAVMIFDVLDRAGVLKLHQ